MRSVVQSAGSAVRVSQSVAVVDASEFRGQITVICGESPSRRELQIIPADLSIVRGLEDFEHFPNFDPDAYLVLPSGLELAMELLRSNHLSTEKRVIWALGRPILETLEALEAAGFPSSTAICGFAGAADDSMLISSGSSNLAFDGESFRAGLRLADAMAPAKVSSGTAERPEHAALDILRQKHLMLLETLEPAMVWTAPFEPGKSSKQESESAQPAAPEVLKLENDLILLKRRHDALERKYSALASSRLGRLTLALWDRRRRSAHTRNNRKALSE